MIAVVRDQFAYCFTNLTRVRSDSVPKMYSTAYFRMVTHPGIGIIQQGLTYTFLFSPKGNALFKEGKYEAAINCYTTGIQLDSSNAVLSANRAMCLLKLKRYVRNEG